MRSLIVALSLAVSAFASDVLVPGNPPLTTGIVQNVTGILEWLAGVNLAAEQHTQVEQLLVESWRQRNPAQVAQWVQLSNLRSQLDALDASQRQILRSSVLAQMQKEGNPLANLVSSSPIPQPVAASTSAPAPAPAGNIDPALTGKWEQRSGGSTITYRDSVTGAFAAPSGNINRYVFMPDGQYEYAELHQVTNYNCTTKYFGYEKGPYSVNGNRITFTQRRHSLEYNATCSPSLNSNKNLPLKTETYFYEIVRTADGLELQINDGKTRWRFTRAQ